MCGRTPQFWKLFLVDFQSSCFLLTIHCPHCGFSQLLTVAMRFACQQWTLASRRGCPGCQSVFIRKLFQSGRENIFTGHRQTGIQRNLLTKATDTVRFVVIVQCMFFTIDVLYSIWWFLGSFFRCWKHLKILKFIQLWKSIAFKKDWNYVRIFVTSRVFLRKKNFERFPVQIGVIMQQLPRLWSPFLSDSV